MSIQEKASLVETRADLEEYLRSLAEDFRACGDKWENADLARYLDALAAWTEDMDGYYMNKREAAPLPSWRLFAEMLAAAVVYE
jgi:hypothetical protein